MVHTVFGLGYVLGELPNSFMKRRLGVASGKTAAGWRGRIFLVVDQADSVVVPLLMGWPLFGYGFEVVLMATVSLTGVHLLLNALLYLLGIRRNL